MPELPEVETMVRGIRPVAEGRIIETVRACPCDCRPLTMSPSIAQMAWRASGRTVVEVRRRAKRVVLRLDDGRAFVIEPRMTGLMLVGDPPDPEHLRVEWRFAPFPSRHNASKGSLASPVARTAGQARSGNRNAGSRSAEILRFPLRTFANATPV